MKEYSVRIAASDSEGRGIARIGGKTVFVAGALAGEDVRCRITHRSSRFDEAETTAVLTPSPQRVPPRCRHYGECGGCTLQHAEFTAQTAIKQRIFEEQLWRLGKIRADTVLPPIYGHAWHYRSRTRLHADGNGSLGYQSRRSHRIVPVRDCPVLPQNADLPSIQAAASALPAGCLNAVELYFGDTVRAVNFVVCRAVPPAAWQNVAARLDAWQLWRQQGRAPAEPFGGDERALAYRLPEFALAMPFRPGDFTQVNQAVNELMVARALRLLEVKPQERVADLFCGLGNFSLPLARLGVRVQGWEGADALTRRARANARANGIADAEFFTADLFKKIPDIQADKILIDPPRAGAHALVKGLRCLPPRMVYVSCNPATLARDAAVLVRRGYRVHSAGIMNMFPHTAHVEAVMRFDLT